MTTKQTLRSRAGKQKIDLPENRKKLPTEPLTPPKTDNWLERNADSITGHGQVIAATGLAGEEFDRI